MTSDLDLLRQFARENSQDAFAEIVRRHVNLVYSAALRQVRSPQLAEEVSQSVFADLARDASKLKPDTILTAWLYQVTRRTAIDVVRKESRRQLREQIAMEMNDMNATANEWRQIEPLLDDAMGALDETDRSAILLRYFENKTLREVGRTLGTNEDAAQKRVSRAVERLREFFSKRNVTVGASGLAVVISTNAVQAAPVGLAVTISTTTALVATTITATTIATHATMNWITAKTAGAIAAAALIAGLGTYLVGQRESNRLRSEGQSLVAQQEKLTRERDAALSASTANNDELERLKKNQVELLRLRGQIRPLQRQLQAMSNHVATLAQATTPSTAQPDEVPDGIEETNQVFLDHVRSEQVRDAGVFAAALRKFVRTHAGELPGDLAQVEALAESALPEGFSQQFELMRSGTVPEEAWAYTFIACEKEPRQLSDGKWMRIYIAAKGGESMLQGMEGMTEADWLAKARQSEEDRKQLLPKDQSGAQP